jgi:hypothetical protein
LSNFNPLIRHYYGVVLVINTKISLFPLVDSSAISKGSFAFVLAEYVFVLTRKKGKASVGKAIHFTPVDVSTISGKVHQVFHPMWREIFE